MLRQKEAPTAANHATATVTTSAMDQPSFVQIGRKLAEPVSSNRTHLAIATTKTTSRVRRPQHKNNMVLKNFLGQCSNHKGRLQPPITSQQPPQRPLRTGQVSSKSDHNWPNPVTITGAIMTRRRPSSPWSPRADHKKPRA